MDGSRCGGKGGKEWDFIDSNGDQFLVYEYNLIQRKRKIVPTGT